MGQVIPIHVERPPQPNEPADFVDAAFARLAALPGFVVREGQVRLARAVRDSFLTGKPLVAQAPTGTGKTIAYLVGALAASKAFEADGIAYPVVVATATAALQEQALNGDIPKLVQAGLLEPGKAVLAKGRGRYLCPRAAHDLHVKAVDRQVGLFDENPVPFDDLPEIAGELLNMYDMGTWDGDRDHLPGAIPDRWEELSSTSESCLATKCDYHSVCPLFKARGVLAYAKIIIANHDLVFSDLELAHGESGSEGVFPASRFLCVFDEGHHLPTTAAAAATAALNVSALLANEAAWSAVYRAFAAEVPFQRALRDKRVHMELLDPGPLLGTLRGLEQVLKNEKFADPDDVVLRYPKGEFPKRLTDSIYQLNLVAGEYADTIKRATSAVRAYKATDALTIAQGLKMLAALKSYVAPAVRATRAFQAPVRTVKWLRRDSQGTLILECAPLEGAEVLQRLVWGFQRIRACIVSATVRDFGGFDRFLKKIGLTQDDVSLLTLDPIFRYENSVLRVALTEYSPRFEEREKFTEEICGLLPDMIDPAEGTLVLFPSGRMMKAVAPALVKKFGADHVLLQGSAGIKALVARHKERMDYGIGSVLCGLASMAEGLDLPGNYCTHVILAALPFTTPTSPVEEERGEELGDRYFAEFALPEMLVKLIQVVGRLIRRETDSGRITVLDRRLYDTRWGQKTLDALPNFQKWPIWPAEGKDPDACPPFPLRRVA